MTDNLVIELKDDDLSKISAGHSNTLSKVEINLNGDSYHYRNAKREQQINVDENITK
ncbi:MAG: hypothetical protein MJ250_06495 [Alphaproteobacteria bacterium]|nr:hypothetical protein [Alphaproteobacteria bacterium]